MLKRITTALTSPFRAIIVKIQRLFNINIITAKILSPLTKSIKKFITLKPTNKADYYVIGKFWVYKKLGAALIITLCAGVFLYFSMFADPISETTTASTSVITETTYDYDDLDLGAFSGITNIRASTGQIVYVGAVEDGVCVGQGTLYDLDGNMVYQGEFANNCYEGAGIAYHSNGTMKYQGNFSANQYSGEGIEYSNTGVVIYQGSFQAGVYSGEGKLYTQEGVLIYEGTFADGVYHGSGTSYSETGIVSYVGEFFQGKAQGIGTLYSDAGKAIYSGAMSNGSINYLSLLDANLTEIEELFVESPIVYYNDDNCVFVFSQAGVILTASCTVRVYVWESGTETSDTSGSMYYMPTSTQTTTQSQSLALTPLAQTLQTSEQSATFITATSKVTSTQSIVSPIAWFVVGGSDDDDDSDSSDTSTDSSTDTSTSGSSSSSSSSSSSTSTSTDTSTTTDSSLPDFITKDITLYYEIDNNIWRSEKDADWEDAKKLVTISKVTVYNGDIIEPPENTEDYDDDLPPLIEDCTAIDFIRQDYPTAMSDVSFLTDKQNSLFVEIQSINHADKIYRKVYTKDNTTYRYCYENNTYSQALYFSVERAY